MDWQLRRKNVALLHVYAQRSAPDDVYDGVFGVQGAMMQRYILEGSKNTAYTLGLFKKPNWHLATESKQGELMHQKVRSSHSLFCKHTFA